MKHSFDIHEAERYGILAATMLSLLRFWVAKAEANDSNFRDGRYWVYNSVEAWTKLIPYASKDQIYRALKKLEDMGAIASGNYNETSYDRTKWYTVEIDDYHFANLRNRISASAKPIPVFKQYNNKKHTKRETDARFLEFWERYPNKTGKAQAEKHWNKLSEEDIEELMNVCLPAYLDFVKGGDKTFIKGGSNYLSNYFWREKHQQLFPDSHVASAPATEWDSVLGEKTRQGIWRLALEHQESGAGSAKDYYLYWVKINAEKYV